MVYYIHIINTPLKIITFIYKKITPPNHIDPFDSIPKLQIVSDKLEGNSKSGVWDDYLQPFITVPPV